MQNRKRISDHTPEQVIAIATANGLSPNAEDVKSRMARWPDGKFNVFELAEMGLAKWVDGGKREMLDFHDLPFWDKYLLWDGTTRTVANG